MTDNWPLFSKISDTVSPRFPWLSFCRWHVRITNLWITWSEWGDYGRGDRKHLPDPPSGGREGLGRDMVVPGWYNIPISYSNVQGIAPQTPLGSLSGLARPNHSTPAIFRQGVWTRIGVHLKRFNPITLRSPVFVWIKIYGQYLPVIYVWSWTF